MFRKISQLIAKHQSKKMWKEIKQRQKQINIENYNKTMITLCAYIQRQELVRQGFILSCDEITQRAVIFFQNLKDVGLIDKNNNPLPSIIETLKGSSNE